MFGNKQGFTLIELMIVVVIVGILAAIAIPNFISMQNQAKEDDTKSVAHIVQLAVEDYAVHHDGKYPNNVEDFIPLLPEGTFLENPFSRSLTEPENAYSNPPIDPKQGGVYFLPSNQQGKYYTIFAYGRWPYNGPIQVIK